ncbi:hypothetical protein Ae717Ps2_7270c [Pseudonocardia sp. Ae717_Ps2]|nr:hypothetical protein Ae717Ps2_7270c [Pseudonocardia sp. Ae717_Ps2]
MVAHRQGQQCDRAPRSAFQLISCSRSFERRALILAEHTGHAHTLPQVARPPKPAVPGSPSGPGVWCNETSPPSLVETRPHFLTRDRLVIAASSRRARYLSRSA